VHFLHKFKQNADKITTAPAKQYAENEFEKYHPLQTASLNRILIK
jgi:hypothetical protein